MNIERTRREHGPVLAELEKLCFSSPWSEAALAEETENPNACFFTAVEDGKILGYAGMHMAAGECYVDNVAVFPAFRRKGVGEALLRALLREAESRGGEFLSLEVRPSNASALALYRKLGFLEEGRRKNFYTGPIEDGLILTKRFQKSVVQERCGDKRADFRN